MDPSWSNWSSTARRISFGAALLAFLALNQSSAKASCGDYLMPLGTHPSSAHHSSVTEDVGSNQRSAVWDAFSFGRFGNPYSNLPVRSLCKDGRCQQAPVVPPSENRVTVAGRQFAITYAVNAEDRLLLKSSWLHPADSDRLEMPYLEISSPPPRR